SRGTSIRRWCARTPPKRRWRACWNGERRVPTGGARQFVESAARPGSAGGPTPTERTRIAGCPVAAQGLRAQRRPLGPSPRAAPWRMTVKRGTREAAGVTEVAGVRLTHPDRVLFPEQGLTKLDLARYYLDVAEWVVPLLAGRPLSLVRCPEGRTGECFFQKHPGRSVAPEVPRVQIAEREKTASYAYVESLPDVIALVQVGALELHAWGSRVDDLERPDQLVFDLDPGEGVEWEVVIEVARSLARRLEELGLGAFLRTTGGKGLHVVTPLEPAAGWDEAKEFARGVARAQVADDPRRLTDRSAKAERP